MNLRMDKDNIVYIDDPKRQDRLVIIPLIGRKYRVESRKFGYLKTFNNQLEACIYCREQII